MNNEQRASIAQSGTMKPAYPPSLIRRSAGRLQRILRNITIEPAIFLITFSTTMDDVSVDQMTIYKSCRIDFGYNDTVCTNIVTDFPDENKLVQEKVNDFKVWRSLVASVFPIFFSFAS